MRCRRIAGAIAILLLVAARSARPADPGSPPADATPFVGLVGIRSPGTLSLSPLDAHVLPGLRADLPVLPFDSDPEGRLLSVDEIRLGGKGWARRSGVFRPYAGGGVTLDFRDVDREAENPLREWLGKTVTTPWIGLGADWQVGKNTVLTTELRADVPAVDLSLETLERNAQRAQFLFGLGHRW